MLKRIFKKATQKSAKELELISFILKKFAYHPKNLQLFDEAITHKSLLSDKIENSNERLEFLGDAILDSVIADLLFNKFPEEDEGYLTKIKSKVVSRKSLADIAETMNLKEIIKYNSARSINISTLEGNAFEAIIGAIYLDGGFEAAKKTILNHVFRHYADLNKILEEEIDFKSKLFIWCQKARLSIDFNVIQESNNKGTWEYEIEAIINEKSYGKGTGNSKKSAEQAASYQTLVLLGEIEP